MRADLHVHTTASDGTVLPQDIVRAAGECSLDAVAVTDHDSVEGIGPALAAAAASPVTVIPAVELSAYDDGVDAHILGYFIDHTDAALVADLIGLRDARLERAMAMIDSLAAGGYVLDVDDVLQVAAGGSVGRSHIARALVGAGHVVSVQDAFERLIGHRRPHYVPKPIETPPRVVERVRRAGGAPVLAHPAISGSEALVPDLLDHGLVGVEVFHPEHSATDSARLAETAARLGLVITGGSDYHGPGAPGPGLGQVLAAPDAVDRLAAAVGA